MCRTYLFILMIATRDQAGRREHSGDSGQQTRVHWPGDQVALRGSRRAPDARFHDGIRGTHSQTTAPALRPERSWGKKTNLPLPHCFSIYLSTDRLIDWVGDWLGDLLIDWLIASLIHWLIDWLLCWSIDWLIDWLLRWSIDWLIDCFVDRLIDWLIDCFVDPLIDWLIDFFIYSSFYCLASQTSTSRTGNTTPFTRANTTESIWWFSGSGRCVILFLYNRETWEFLHWSFITAWWYLQLFLYLLGHSVFR